jgi:enoyl-CoA hydratase/carnithine racemase
MSETAAPSQIADDSALLVESKGGACWITLNRPQAANGITPDQCDRLVQLLEHASSAELSFGAGRGAPRTVADTTAGPAMCFMY